MKKVFIVGVVMSMTMAASAQSKKIPQALPEPYQNFLNRNQSVSSVGSQKDAIVIKLKNGKNERYLLNEKGIIEAESKYGKLPVIPPPPPPQPAAF